MASISQRAAEIAAAKKYGTVYKTGQAAGTAAKQAALAGSYQNIRDAQGTAQQQAVQNAYNAPRTPAATVSGLTYQDIRDAQGTAQQQAVQNAYNAPRTPAATVSGLTYQDIRDAQGTAQQQAVQNAYNGITPPAGAPLTDSFNRTSSKMNMDTSGMTIEDVNALNATKATNEGTSQPPAVVGTPYSLESDPVYLAAIAAGQSQFNAARAAAMANKNSQEMQLNNDRRNLDLNATEARRRTAGNYAARGMAGGATGALTLAEMQNNAKQISAQTDIKDQIASLNQNFLENYGNAAQTDAAGNPNFDWTSTLIGQNYKTQAAQNALTAQLAKMGIQ